jgi:hypothetical protein
MVHAALAGFELDVVPQPPLSAPPASAAGTERLADAVLPAPPSVEVTAPVALFMVPTAVPDTLTLNVQEAFGASVAAVKVMTLALAAAPPVRVVAAFGLVMVKLSDVEPNSWMVAEPNACEIVGGAATATVTAAVALEQASTPGEVPVLALGVTQ